MTHHFLRGGLCEQAHDQHGQRGDGGQDHGEVEVVHVLHHAWAQVPLSALGLWVDEVQHQPNDAQQQPDHQAPEGALGEEGSALPEQGARIREDPASSLGYRLSRGWLFRGSFPSLSALAIWVCQWWLSSLVPLCGLKRVISFGMEGKDSILCARILSRLVFIS